MVTNGSGLSENDGNKILSKMVALTLFLPPDLQSLVVHPSRDRDSEAGLREGPCHLVLWTIAVSSVPPALST